MLYNNNHLISNKREWNNCFVLFLIKQKPGFLVSKPLPPSGIPERLSVLIFGQLSNIEDNP